MQAAAFSTSRFLMTLCLGCFVALTSIGQGHAQKIEILATPDLDVPYVSTPQNVVEAMLRLADAKSGDVHYDLGSGDGRIVITAVKQFGVTKGIGVDLNPERVSDALANAQKAGVAERTRFVHGDVFDFDFSEASVLTMYLLTRVNLKLRPKILALEPGTRVVSHDFKMGRWQPDKHVKVSARDIYLWIVPAKVAGRWVLGDYRLDLEQRFQKVAGVLRSSSAKSPIRDVVLEGPRLRFTARVDGKELRFNGEVDRDTIKGSLNGEPVQARRAD